VNSITYVETLLELNPNISEANIATFGFGLLEEVEEWLASDNDISEVGDVVAYYVLLATVLGKEEVQVAQALDNLHLTVADSGVKLKLAGALKRYFREGNSYKERVLESAYAAIAYVVSLSAYNIGEVCENNVSKLQRRLARQGNYFGEGSSR
jgi:hypothetical protein